jgi:hypothetical protein
MALDVARDYSPLRAMRHLTRLTLNIVEDLDANLASLQSLTQVGGGGASLFHTAFCKFCSGRAVARWVAVAQQVAVQTRSQQSICCAPKAGQQRPRPPAALGALA